MYNDDFFQNIEHAFKTSIGERIMKLELPDETFTSYVAKIKKNCMYSNHQTKNPTTEIFW